MFTMASRGALIVFALGVLISVGDARPKVIPKLGPCSATITQTIYFSDVNTLLSRTQYPKTETVLLYMTANVTLTAPVTFGESFSCTIIKADPALDTQMPFFNYNSNDNHTIVVAGATNIMFNGVGFFQNYTETWMPQCKQWGAPAWVSPPWYNRADGFWDNCFTCAGVVIYRSFNIQITKSVILGRVDLIRTASVEISYSNITYNNNVTWSKTMTSAGYGWSFSTIRVMLCGDNVGLVRANNRITNNFLFGSATTVLLYWGAVGNIVQNNYITSYSFSGLQCGQGMRNVADCMLNTFELNFVTPELGVDVDADGAGIYYDLHWISPGNRDSCNYLLNTYPRCYYIDYATSGLLVEGGVCMMNNGRAGDWYGNSTGPWGSMYGNYIKLNTGKMNVFKSVVYVHNGRSANLGIFSCQNWCVNRCGETASAPEGNIWWNTYLSTYDNELWKTNYPYMSTICTAKGYTNNGVYYSCAPNITTVPNPGTPVPYCYQNMTKNANGLYSSPSYELSGNCSGWPVLNDIDIIFVTNFTTTSTYFNSIYPLDIQGDCNPLGDTISKLNKLTLAPPKLMPDSMGFNDEWGGDYGADDPSAMVYQRYPDFYSCPRRLVGPQTASFAAARSNSASLSKFNKFGPSWLSKAPSKDLLAVKPDFTAWAEKIARNARKTKLEGDLRRRKAKKTTSK